MPVADTSFLVALRNSEDTHHKKALRSAQTNTFVIPAVLLHEFLLVVWKRLRDIQGPSIADQGTREALEDIHDQPVFTIETHYDVDEAAEIYRSDPRLNYADAVGIAVALERKEKMMTFDGPQRQVLDTWG